MKVRLLPVPPIIRKVIMEIVKDKIRTCDCGSNPRLGKTIMKDPIVKCDKCFSYVCLFDVKSEHPTSQEDVIKLWNEKKFIKTL